MVFFLFFVGFVQVAVALAVMLVSSFTIGAVLFGLGIVTLALAEIAERLPKRP